VLLYAVEVDILETLDAPDRAGFLSEAAQAYRTRSELLTKRGRADAARADTTRAEKLNAQAKKLNATPAAKKSTGRFEVSNGWTTAVTVIVDGVTYSVSAGETRTITVPAGAFTYEVRDIQGPVTRQVRAGESYAIRIESR
jgi:hypothetical protein